MGGDKRDGGFRGGGRSNKKAKYVDHTAGKGKGHDIGFHSKGFFCTVMSGYEGKGGRDLNRILEEHYEKLAAGAGAGAAAGGDVGADVGTDAPAAGGSVADALQAELAELKEKGKERNFRWQKISNGVLWVPMPGDSPTVQEVAESVMSSLETSRSPVSRFLLRFFPIVDTCYAKSDEIVKAMQPLVEAVLPAGAEGDAIKKYAVVFECRSNGELKRDKMNIIDGLAKMVPDCHTVDLDKPDVAIVVQVLKNTALLTIVPKYRAREKYNLQTLGTPLDVLEEQRAEQRAATKARNAEIAADAAAQEGAAAEPAAAEPATAEPAAAEAPAADKDADVEEAKAADAEAE